MMTIGIIVAVIIIVLLVNTIIENKIAIRNNKDLIDNINNLNERQQNTKLLQRNKIWL